jgi:hypothetical protein
VELYDDEYSLLQGDRFAKTPAEAVDLALSLAPAAETGKTVERTFRSLR